MQEYTKTSQNSNKRYQICDMYIRSFVLFFLILLFSLSMSAQKEDESEKKEFHHCFFNEKSISTGAGAIYSVPNELVGLSVKAYYNFGESWCVGPEVNYIQSAEKSLLDINLVAHYIIETPWVGVYPLVGVNYTSESEENGHSNSAFGGMYGAGMHRNFNRVSLFAEYSRVESKLADQFISIGAFLTLNLNL
jgi:hypothetical protein